MLPKEASPLWVVWVGMRGSWFLLCKSEIQNKEIGAILWAQGFIEDSTPQRGWGTLIEMGEVYGLIWGVFNKLFVYVTEEGKGV